MKIPKFNSQGLREQVFIHRSYLNETGKNLESNERLEFLGDSVLSLVVSTHIFDQHKNLKEGQLTNIRSVLTNTETLFQISSELGLGEHLKLSHGEEQSGGRTNKSILADTLEALIGGIYLDRGLDAAREFIEDTILAKGEGIIKAQGLKDPKSMLQEKLQETYKTSPSYEVTAENGPDHNKQYTVGVYIEGKFLADGKGTSKQIAEKEAAKNALKTLS